MAAGVGVGWPGWGGARREEEEKEKGAERAPRGAARPRARGATLTSPSPLSLTSSPPSPPSSLSYRHADLITLKRDIHSTAALKPYLKAYPANYEYEHIPLGRAADGAAGFGFSIAIDKGVRPKPQGAHGDQAGCPPSDTLSLTYLVFERPEGGMAPGGTAPGEEGGQAAAEGEEGATSPPLPAPDAPRPPPKITDVFMQRELSVDEAVRKLGAPPVDYSRVLDEVPLAQLEFGSAPAHSPDAAAAHAVAAEAINEAWRTGNATACLDHLAPDFVRVNALTGSTTKGKGAFARMLAHVFESYELLWHSSAVAVTPGSKAVTFFTAAAQWAVPGGQPEFCQPSGQSILIFDEADPGMVKWMIDFSTPLPGMEARLTSVGGGGESEGKAAGRAGAEAEGGEPVGAAQGKVGAGAAGQAPPEEVKSPEA